MARVRRQPSLPDAPVAVQRSIGLPVQECLSHSWKDFMRLLHDAWNQSTCLANWAAQTLRRHDVTRTPAMKELPKWDAIDLYALAFGREQEGQGREYWKCSTCARKWHYSQTERGNAPAHERGKTSCLGVGQPALRQPRSVLPPVAAAFGSEFFAGARVAAASILRKVQRKYLQERGKIVWRRERRTPEFLYPYPFPVHQQAWLPYWSDKNRPLVSLALPGGRVTLRLRDGDEFRAKLRTFGEIIDGAITQQELVLGRQRSFGHNGRLDGQRRAGGGHRESYRVMVRIAHQRPVVQNAGEATALVRMGADPFLSLTVHGEERQWVLHAAWVQQWLVAHRLFLDAFADDLKYEKRWPGHKRKSLNRYRERRCDKHDRHMKSFRQMTACQVIGHALRRKVGVLEYDDSCRDFATADFPWYLLAQTIEEKCKEFGIVFRSVASGEAVDEEIAPANDTTEGG